MISCLDRVLKVTVTEDRRPVKLVDAFSTSETFPRRGTRATSGGLSGECHGLSMHNALR